MPKQITIHVGAPKTGTSSIQGFLAANDELLRQRGLLYPTGRLHPVFGAAINHSVLVFALTGMMHHLFDFDRDTARQITHESLAKALADPENDHVLLSHEMLYSTINDLDVDLLQEIIGDNAVRILIYARRLDDWNESLYRQIIWGRIQPTSTVHHGLRIPKIEDTPHIRNLAQHSPGAVADRYAEILPQAEITVRPFSIHQKNGGLISGFLDVLGVPTEKILADAQPPRRLNTSRPNAATLLLWHLQQTDLPTDVIFKVSRAALKQAKIENPPEDIESGKFHFLPEKFARLGRSIYANDVRRFPSLSVDEELAPIVRGPMAADLSHADQMRVLEWLAPHLQQSLYSAVATALSQN